MLNIENDATVVIASALSKLTKRAIYLQNRKMFENNKGAEQARELFANFRSNIKSLCEQLTAHNDKFPFIVKENSDSFFTISVGEQKLYILNKVSDNLLKNGDGLKVVRVLNPLCEELPIVYKYDVSDENQSALRYTIDNETYYTGEQLSHVVLLILVDLVVEYYGS